MTETEYDTAILPMRDRMLRFAQRILGDATQAEDATHDVLEKLWRKRILLGPCSKPEALAMTAVRNRCYDLLRMRREQVPPEAAAGTIETGEAWDTRRIVEQAIASLPSRQREVLHLREIEGYPVQEIAAILSTDPAQVRVYLSRGRTALKSKLQTMLDHGL